MLVFYSIVPRGQSSVAISRADGAPKSQDSLLEGEVCEVHGCTLFPAEHWKCQQAGQLV